MASLPLLCPNPVPSPSPRRRTSRPLLPIRRLHVSSAAAQTPNSADSPPPKIDRRNILLGLGGLYGAGTLASTPAASANPVTPPDLNNCGFATDFNTGERIDTNCCLTREDTIIDYKLPPVLHMKCRPSAHRVSPEYICKYNMAIERMRRLPDNDPRSFMSQANIHCAYCNTVYKREGTDVGLQVHCSWLFFPFHRWYMYFYERILGKLINDPTFALPFWNWDNPKGMTMPPMFLDPESALYDANRNQEHLPPNVVDLGMNTDVKDTLQVVTNNLTIVHNEMIRANADVYDFMGKCFKYKLEDPGPGAPERGSHTAVHVWVGTTEGRREDMGNFYSAGRDPLFYCHHANVDRMWMLWQHYLPPNPKIPDKFIKDPDFLNSSFVFYDENAQLVRVFVKDAVDHLRMGYDFERIDLPWLDYRPPRQCGRARVNRLRTAVPTAASLFPLKLDGVVRFQVDKTTKGQADESLVLENITVDTSKFVKVDVFVNDEDDNAGELDKAAYVGTYAQVPHKSSGDQFTTTSIKLNLEEAYKDMEVLDNDDTVVVTLVPRHQGPGITIGGIKIVLNPPPEK